VSAEFLTVNRILPPDGAASFCVAPACSLYQHNLVESGSLATGNSCRFAEDQRSDAMNRVNSRLRPGSEPSSQFEPEDITVAVLIPCYNEQTTIAQVVRDFRASLPNATVYVYDNNSTDATRTVAADAGAIVRWESQQGKGNVVRRMFADIEADIYVLVDGDATYDASMASRMVEVLRSEHLDMVVGCRKSDEGFRYRRGHHFGNAMFNKFLKWMFGNAFTDILSGYRAFSRRYVKNFPSLTSGFEIETEMAVYALTLRMPVVEIETRYVERPEYSVSKLRTYSDGLRILTVMLALFRQERPALFFSLIALALALASVVLSIPLAITYAETGLVPRFPTAILSTGLMIAALLCLCCGLILDTVTRGRREMRRLAYLGSPGPR
jgi:Glycosyl transferase family 2